MNIYVVRRKRKKSTGGGLHETVRRSMRKRNDGSLSFPAPASGTEYDAIMDVAEQVLGGPVSLSTESNNVRATKKW